jgi:ATP-dependent RNA helicase HelY
MTINLISQFGAERARTSLEASFAQYQADKAVVGLARQIKRNETGLQSLLEEMECHLGDFDEYWNLRAQIKDLEKSMNKQKKSKALLIEEEIIATRKAMRNHPCHGCSDREFHARIAERAGRLRKEIKGLSDRVSNRTDVIARRFDLVQIMLEKYGYLEDGVITKWGLVLAKIYGETDLLIAEMIRQGAFDELNASEIVSVLSALVYEARRDESPKIPHGAVQRALVDLTTTWNGIHEDEVEIGLEAMREPDFGFCMASYRWASGHSLSAILKGTELTVGDFVRSMKQIIDLLRQIANATPHLEGVARTALERVDRGIISYAGAVA